LTVFSARNQVVPRQGRCTRAAVKLSDEPLRSGEIPVSPSPIVGLHD
jgi:hypothetical protein